MRTTKRYVPWLFGTPAILMFACVVVVPLFWTVGMSFFSWDGIGEMQFIGIENYKRMFQDRTFIASFWQNLQFCLISAVYQFVVGLFLAILLSSVTKFRNILKVVYFVPCIVATVAVAQIFTKLLALEPLGVFNMVVQAFGGTPKSWLGQSSTALIAMSLVDAYKYCAIYMVIFYSGLISVSNDIVEAAYIDGCGWFRQFIYIKLPMIKGVCGMVLVLLLNGCLKAFEMPYVLTSGKPGTSTEMIATYMYKTAFSTMRFGYASAMAAFLLVESLVVVTVVKKLTSKTDIE